MAILQTDDLDFDGFRLYNLGAPQTATEPVLLGQFSSLSARVTAAEDKLDDIQFNAKNVLQEVLFSEASTKATASLVNDQYQYIKTILDSGMQGPEGPQGPIGPQGEDGPPGPKGDTGDVGPQGPAGADGVDGIDGATGPKGDKGDTGDEGPQGPQGIQGVPGNDGATGPKGDTGDTGPEGPEGPQGPQGIPGNDGADGADGATGPKGDTGDTGPVGPKGDTGDTGPQGIQGPPGNDGATGATGAAGTPGEKWYSGSGAPGTGTGIVGDWYLNTANSDVYEKTGTTTWVLRLNIKGPQGIQGIQGDPGAAGEKWYSGSVLPTSIVGDVGDWYINTVTADIYEKTGSSTWTLRLNTKGADGDPGSNSVWTPIGTYVLGGIAFQDVLIPAGITVVRFTIVARPGVSGDQISLLCSRTAGASFITTSDYQYSTLAHNGATVTGAGATTGTSFPLTFATDATTLPAIAEGILHVGSSTTRTRYMTQFAAYNASTGSRNGVFSGLSLSNGTCNALRFSGVNAWGSGTLVVEGVA